MQTMRAARVARTFSTAAGTREKLINAKRILGRPTAKGPDALGSGILLRSDAAGFCGPQPFPSDAFFYLFFCDPPRRIFLRLLTFSDPHSILMGFA